MDKSKPNAIKRRTIVVLCLLGIVFFSLLSYMTEQVMFIVVYLVIFVVYILKNYFLKTTFYRLRMLIYLVVNLCCILLAIQVVRVFVLDLYNIPSGSMQQTLDIGDKIIVRKLSSNALKPKFRFLDHKSTMLPSHNDIYVFTPPFGRHVTFVKRVVALPGDTIACVKNQVFINHLLEKENPKYQWRYRLLTPSGLDIYTVLDEVFQREVAIQKHATPDKYFAYLSSQEIKMLQQQYPNIAVWRFSIKAKKPSRSYPWSEYVEGSFHNFGPVIVPKEGMNINLTPGNIAWYADIIQRENPNVYTEDSLVLIDNQPALNYTFKHDYYFMMGDNRHASMDSRKWGFVPQERLIGKVVKVVRGIKMIDVAKISE